VNLSLHGKGGKGKSEVFEAQQKLSKSLGAKS